MRGRVLAASALVFGSAVLLARPAAASPLAARAVDRVLVISLPAVKWADLQAADVPNLRALFEQSALGDLATRTADGRRNSLPSGYASIGAGARASAVNALAGQALEVSEPYGGVSAGEAFRQRTGVRVTEGIVHLGVSAIDEENADGLYGAEPGELGSALRRAGIDRAVVANGDGAQPVVDGALPVYQRSAATALMDHDGVVPGGAVGGELLEADATAPFGVRADLDASYAAFTRAWTARSVVLVEASDLSRVDQFSSLTTPEIVAAQRARALRRFDTLVGRMLAHVDLDRDAVVVVSPAASTKGGGLTTVAIRAPGVDRGLLKSATLRRTGFVSVVDVGPTVLSLLGLDRPEPMEGRVMQVVAHDPASRTDFLVSSNTDGTFRDEHVLAATWVVLALAGVLGLGAAVALRRGRGVRVVEWGALAVLGFLTATYGVDELHVTSSSGAYWAAQAALALVFAGACRFLGRRHTYAPIGIALAAIVAVHLGDLLVGARLELDSVFGYTATVGIRASGQGNLTFAQVSAAVLLLAGLLAWRVRGRRVIYGIVALLGATLVIMAFPRWGGDFGAALAGAPAFGLLAWQLLGRKVRVRSVVMLGAALVVSGLVVGFVDVLRPADQQTHIGRFFGQVGDEGPDRLFLVLRRKAQENLDAFTGTKFVWLLPIVVLVLVAVWRLSPGLRAVVREHAPVRQSLAALGVVAVLGYALNDSGIAIPALMGLVLECVAVYVAAVARAGPAPRGARRPPPVEVDSRYEPAGERC